jgi:hypothetical protein
MPGEAMRANERLHTKSIDSANLGGSTSPFASVIVVNADDKAAMQEQIDMLRDVLVSVRALHIVALMLSCARAQDDEIEDDFALDDGAKRPATKKRAGGARAKTAAATAPAPTLRTSKKRARPNKRVHADDFDDDDDDNELYGGNDDDDDDEVTYSGAIAPARDKPVRARKKVRCDCEHAGCVDVCHTQQPTKLMDTDNDEDNEEDDDNAVLQ